MARKGPLSAEVLEREVIDAEVLTRWYQRARKARDTKRKVFGVVDDEVLGGQSRFRRVAPLGVVKRLSPFTHRELRNFLRRNRLTWADFVELSGTTVSGEMRYAKPDAYLSPKLTRALRYLLEHPEIYKPRRRTRAVHIRERRKRGSKGVKFPKKLKNGKTRK